MTFEEWKSRGYLDLDNQTPEYAAALAWNAAMREAGSLTQDYMGSSESVRNMGVDLMEELRLREYYP